MYAIMKRLKQSERNKLGKNTIPLPKQKEQRKVSKYIFSYGTKEK